MAAGKVIRLGAWLRAGRAFLAALDEIIPRGLQASAVLPDTLSWLSRSGVDGVVLHIGIVTHYASLMAEMRLPFIAKLTTNSVWVKNHMVRGAVGSVETALSLGACGVAVNVFVGSEFEKEHFDFLSKTIAAGERWGMPIIAFINPPPDKQFDPFALAYCARIGAELGADVIKTDYSGDPESFSRVTSTCHVPILVEDTPLGLTNDDTIQTTLESVQSGGAGVLFGQRLWGSDGRKELVSKLRDIIHRGHNEF